MSAGPPDETWEQLKERLENELRFNPLDVENPPNPIEPKLDQPYPMVWTPSDQRSEANPDGKNSVALLNSIKKWEMELPNMVLLVHGGCAHPLQLVQQRGTGNQRAAFLKSRPRFNDSYFDGQRDPAEGWMAAWNAWRYPAFHVGPRYALAEFTFKPPHTLFIDASLQAQEDADLITAGDRANYEYIMDAVTHQPLGRQAAIKGADGVFYWDLSGRTRAEAVGLVQSSLEGGAQPNLRMVYDEWWKGMQQTENNSRLTRAKSRFLVGVTKPKNAKAWERVTTALLKKETQRKEKEADSSLTLGEIRVELMSFKLSRNGLVRLGVLNPAAAAGDGLVLIKVDIPGDEQEITEPFPMRRGICKSPYQKRSYHESERAAELHEILHSPDPEKSEVVLTLALCNKNGAELQAVDQNGNIVSKGIIATAKLGLKEMLREQKLTENGTAEIQGVIELSGILGLPPKEDKKAKKPDRKSRASAQSERKSSSGMEQQSPSGAASEAGDSEPFEEEEKPTSLGEIRVRIAVCPPDPSRLTAATVGGSGTGGTDDAAAGDGTASGGGDTGAGISPPSSMMQLTKIALANKEAFRRASASVRSEEAAVAQEINVVAVQEGASLHSTGAHAAGHGAGVVRANATLDGDEAPSPSENDDGGNKNDADDDDVGEHALISSGKRPDVGTIAKMFVFTMKKDSIMYTFAYWLKWKPRDAISDQLLFFGEPRNQPALIRGSKLGALVDNQFCATDYDPRLAGENWQLLVVTNDGSYSKFWIGYSSVDDTGCPVPANAQDPEPGRDRGDVRTEFSAEVQIRRLSTTGRGAGLLAQAWIWPRPLEHEEIRELWLETKQRYPAAQRGLPKLFGAQAYREPPQIDTKAGGVIPRPMPAKKQGELPPVQGVEAWRKKDEKEVKPWEKYDPIIAKDTAAMLEIPLAAKLAFQRLLNVFSVLVDYASYSGSFIVIDRVHNMSCTAELMMELALRRNPTSPPVVLLMDHRKRLEDATRKVKQLIRVGFLIDEEKAYGGKLTSHEFAMGADLRRLVTPAGLAWLRASPKELKGVEKMIEPMAQEVQGIYRGHGDDAELQKDGRPKMPLIWKNFYQAQLFASGTHYIIFDSVEPKGRSVLSTLGTCGTVFLNGNTDTYKKMIECIEDGSPLLLLESTGGVTQALAYVTKAVRLLKPKWDVDFVMRLVTEYKARAARDKNGKVQQEVNKKYMLENIHLLDKELARIDLILSVDDDESWMANFGLPEVLMLFEIWQRAPDFLLRQLQTCDVMKRSAESLLDLFTSCFSNPSAIPELGLGNAEIKVVATAWNRHLLLYNNARIYNYRSWIMQFTLYFLGFTTTALSVITSLWASLGAIGWLSTVMLVLPIIVALLGTVSTRLRQQQKFSVCKMASYDIVSEIYKFRVRAMEYDQLALAAALNAKNNAGKDKKKDDDSLQAPISAKDKDRLARQVFVQRVQQIYSNCMSSEMAKGTSITHTSNFGMDPARLLRGDDTGPADDEKDTRAQLTEHVANRLYFLWVKEWALGADVVKAENDALQKKRNEQLLKTCKKIARTLFMLLAKVAYLVIMLSILASGAVYGRVMKLLGRADLSPSSTMKSVAPSSSEGDEDDEGATGEKLTGTQKRIAELKDWWSRMFGNMDNVQNLDSFMDEEEIMTGEKLDETYVEEEDDDAGKKAAGAPAGGGGAKRIRDDFFSSITIDDYMQYRAKPVCAYLEKTAPWRGFWMQVLEVTIFFFSSSGAVLVGLEATPFVALTVAAASIATSFMEFSNIRKQVEAYNQALNMVHNMMNDWDGKTRTERRTRQTIKQVVGTVEAAMQLVAVALTDALPATAEDEEGEGDEEKEEEK